MAKDLANTFKEVVSYRDQQFALFNEVNIEHHNIRQRKERNTGQDAGFYIELDQNYEQLKGRYKELFVLSSQEFTRVSECLDKLKRIILRREAKLKKRKIIDDTSTDGETTSASEVKRAVSTPTTRKGDVWNHDGIILPKQSQVAALVDQHSKPRLWILASIRSYSAERGGRYEVVDEDAGDDKNPNDGPIRKLYHLDPSKIIPLPSLEEVPLSVRRQFAKNERVLAIFPGTTVLYPANVIQFPRKTKTDNYSLEFDDDEGQFRDVNAKFVVPFPTNYE